MRPKRDMLHLALPMTLWLFGATACDNKPAERKPATSASDTTYKFSFEFAGAKITGKHNGSFKAFAGSIRVFSLGRHIAIGSVIIN